MQRQTSRLVTNDHESRDHNPYGQNHHMDHMDAQNPYDQGAMDQGYDSYDQGVQGQNGPGWGNARKMNRQQRNR